MDIIKFRGLKNKTKISMLTCYDYWSAKILNSSEVHALLVGDSLAMVMHGHNSTLPASLDMMALHTTAVVKGAPDKLIVSDMPFLSYRKSLDENMRAVELLMKTGAHAIKLEGVEGNLELIKHVVASGVPVMGHIGLTPQSVNQLGGFKVQGRGEDQALKLTEGALALEAAGCFSIVLECVPSPLAGSISKKLSIPTIGIGAGPDTDGQILVLQDMLGTNSDFKPKFLRQYAQIEKIILTAANDFHKDVKDITFPNLQESYE